MISALLKNELKLYLTQPLCWVAFIMGISFTALVSLNFNGLEQNALKQLLFTQSMLLMLVQPLFIGVMSVVAFWREQQAGMNELIDSTPITPTQWCISRAGGLILLSLTLQIFIQLIVIFSLWKNHPAMMTSSLLLWSGAFLLLQQIPAIMLWVSLQLWCSQKSKQIMLVYLLTVAIWLGYVLLAAATGSPLMANSQIASPMLWQLMLYLDPYAITPFIQQLMHGTETNLSGNVALNRILILSACLFFLLRSLKMAKHNASFQHQKTQKKQHKNFLNRLFNRETKSQQTSQVIRPIAPQAIAQDPHYQQYHSLQVGSGNKATLISVVNLIRLQCKLLLRQRMTWVTLGIIMFLLATEVYFGIIYAEQFSHLVPSSRDALNRVFWDLFPAISLLLLALWSNQISWLNKNSRLDEIIAATPVNSKVLLLSQLISLWILTIIYMLLSLTAVAITQVLKSVPLDVFEYLQQSGYAVLPLLLWCALMLVCHALLRSAFKANAFIAILLVIAMTPIPSMLGLLHPLWHIMQTPLQMPDALWAYQASGDSFWPFILFWVLLISLTFVIALQFYHRGTGYSGVRWKQLRLAKWQTTSIAMSLITFALAICMLAQGFSLHQQLSSAGMLQSKTERQTRRADYEKKYQHWQQQAQPIISKVYSEVDLQPDIKQASLKVQYTLSNPHAAPIKQLLLGQIGSSALNVTLQQVQLQGAHLQAFDRPLGQYIFTFDTPMQAGEQRQLSFHFQLQESALETVQTHQILRPSFSYLRSVPLFPVIGFAPQYQLLDEQDRIKFGLKKLPITQTVPSQLAAMGNLNFARYDWAQLETVLSVPIGLQGISQGALKKQWQSNGRHYFHYQTAEPVRNIPAFIAVPWQPQQSEIAGIQLQIFSPEYNAATDLTMQAMQQTLTWFQNKIGAYPGEALRLIVMPDIGPTGYALPQLVLINHKVGVRAFQAPNAGFSQIYRRATHEVAHQWFGHGLGNGVLGDGAFMVEAMAKYAELVLIEQQFGHNAMQALVSYEQERFQLAQARSKSLNKGLIDADETHDLYSRATLVFATLRAELGDQVITDSLHQLWQDHRYPKQPARAMDFVLSLLAHSPEKHQALIRRLLLEADIETLLISEDKSDKNVRIIKK